MNREDFRKAIDKERELYRSPLPPWARKAVTQATIISFVAAVAAIGMVAFGIAYLALRIIWYIVQ